MGSAGKGMASCGSKPWARIDVAKRIPEISMFSSAVTQAMVKEAPVGFSTAAQSMRHTEQARLGFLANLISRLSDKKIISHSVGRQKDCVKVACI
jgi:hypothetical protein